MKTHKGWYLPLCYILSNELLPEIASEKFAKNAPLCKKRNIRKHQLTLRCCLQNPC